MQQTGIVIQTENDRALIAVGRLPSCSGQCAGCGGCNAQRHTVWLTTPLRLNIGDTVQLSARDGIILRAAALVYGLPLALFLITACIMWQISHSTLPAAVSAFGVSALSIYLIKQLDARLAPPLQITRILTSGQTVPVESKIFFRER